jgi:hypothetical protein
LALDARPATVRRFHAKGQSEAALAVLRGQLPPIYRNKFAYPEQLASPGKWRISAVFRQLSDNAHGAATSGNPVTP